MAVNDDDHIMTGCAFRTHICSKPEGVEFCYRQQLAQRARLLR